MDLRQGLPIQASGWAGWRPRSAPNPTPRPGPLGRSGAAMLRRSTTALQMQNNFQATLQRPPKRSPAEPAAFRPAAPLQAPARDRLRCLLPDTLQPAEVTALPACLLHAVEGRQEARKTPPFPVAEVPLVPGMPWTRRNYRHIRTLSHKPAGPTRTSRQ